MKGAEGRVLAAMVLFAVVWLIDAAIRGSSSSEMDRAARFVAAVLSFIVLAKYPARPGAFWSGIAIGAIGAVALAMWERFVEGTPRASGYNHPIQFGNIAMLLGLLCVCGLGWSVQQQRKIFWSALLLVGFLSGLVASLLSGSRGGWIALPLALFPLYLFYRPWIRKRVLVGVVATASFLLLFAYLIPETGVQNRVANAFNDVRLYDEGKVNTPVGSRLEMWNGAVMLISERPLLGWGQGGYEQRMEEYVGRGLLVPEILEYGHAHNEYLDVQAKRGVFGLVSLLIVYALPVFYFTRTAVKSPSLGPRAFAAAGSTVCLSYAGFGISQTFLSHNSGVMVFAFLLVVCLSFLHYDQKAC